MGLVGTGAVPLAQGLGEGELLVVRITLPETLFAFTLRVHPEERFNQQRLVAGAYVQRSHFWFLEQRLQHFWKELTLASLAISAPQKSMLSALVHFATFL